MLVCWYDALDRPLRRGKLNSQFIVTARIDLSIFTQISNFKVSSYCHCNRGRSPGAVRPYGRTLVSVQVTGNNRCIIPWSLMTSGGFKGGKGGANAQMHPPLAASNVFFRTYLYEACSKQQPGTDTHSHISFLLISRRLSRPRVASRYSVRTSTYSLASYDNNYVCAFTRRKWAWQPKNFPTRFARQY